MTGNRVPRDLQELLVIRRSSGARPRDSQRERVYESERAALLDDTLMSHKDLQNLLNRIAKSKSWQNKVFTSGWPRNIPTIRFSPRGNGGGHYAPWEGYYGTIMLTPTGCTRRLLMHELAHHVTEHAHYRAAWHGWEFCAIELQLVSRWMGADEARRLKAEFRKRKVKFSPPRPKRSTIDAGQKADNAARLAVIREQRLGERGRFALASPEMHTNSTKRYLIAKLGSKTYHHGDYELTSWDSKAKIWTTQGGVTRARDVLKQYLGTDYAILDLETMEDRHW